MTILIMYKIYKYITDYILPSRCASCAEIIYSNEDFCSNCWKKLHFITKPYCVICGRPFNISILEGMKCGKCLQANHYYDLARSLIKFDEYSKKIIHNFKYKDKTSLAKTFTKLLYNQYQHELHGIDYIIPVPMNRFKRLFRMYNPALILALEISKRIRTSVVPGMLIKTKWTKAQTYLSKNEREKNLAGSIIMNKKYQINGKRILLIDDVLTTGTTINKCAKILKAAGARYVVVMTIAMT